MGDVVLGWWHPDGRETLFDLREIPWTEISVEDIALALAKLNRWGGRVPVPYSVAEHSVDCLHLARRAGEPVEVQRECLLHDVAEAFLGDVPSPLKAALPRYLEFETLVQAQVNHRFDLGHHGVEVKRYDVAARERELARARAGWRPLAWADAAALFEHQATQLGVQ